RRARTRPSGRGGPRFPFPLSRLGLREQVAQPAKAAEHPGFDRTDRLSEPLRELGLREAAVVRELEGLALLIRKLPQRELHALALEPQPDDVLRRSHGGRVRGVVDWLGAAAVLAPPEIDGTAMHQRQLPRQG